MGGCKKCEYLGVCESVGIPAEEVGSLLVAMELFRNPEVVERISEIDFAGRGIDFPEIYRQLEPLLESCTHVELSCALDAAPENGTILEYAAG